MLASQSNKKKVAFVTTCHDDWGGCDELWYRSIPYLKNAGHDLIIYKTDFNFAHPIIKGLLEDQIEFRRLNPSNRIDKRIARKLTFLRRKITNPGYTTNYVVENFYKRLVKDRPTLVIISQAINFDGLHYAYQCMVLNIPYIIVSHKAVDFYWPPAHDKKAMRQALNSAIFCCFVSSHNLRLTENQFALKLRNSKLIFNPIKINRQILPYPSVRDGLRLACLGRLFLLDKGQDILISVFSQKKWRERPITVSIIGIGPDLVNIEDMIAFHKITNISILPYIDNVEEVWLTHHALILPSRSEGLPLTIIEAMVKGRPIITTNAGGNAEMVEEGISGFVGEANIRSFDEALEKAWHNRHRWESMGITAAKSINKNIPEVPEKDFAELLINVL